MSLADGKMPVTAPPKAAAAAYTTDVTGAAVRFIAGTTPQDVPADVTAMAVRCMVDTTGLFVAGLLEPSARIVMDQARHDGGCEEALLLGSGGMKVPVAAAARVLALSAHAHDFDDTQVSNDPNHVYGLLTHPSTAPLTAAIVLSDRLGNVDGARFMAAFAIGFEVSCKISEWLKPDHYLRGHHSSGTVATFGAAATAAVLMGLTDKEIANALGVAAAMASGIRASFGTMSKPLHVGRAAENGVTAALLAARGFTGDPHALDGRWGFASVLAGGFDEHKTAEGFGNTWSILDPGVSIKPYPSGILTHQAMDMIRDCVRGNDIKPGEVERIEFFAGSNILNPIRYPIAANGLQAKFSMAALISMLVLFRRAGIAQFADAVVADESFQQMQRKITVTLDPEIEGMGFDRIRSRAVFHLSGGRTVRANADERYRGGPLMPLSEADLEEKFTACVDPVAPALAPRLLQEVRAVPSASDVGSYLKTLGEVEIS
ncbi:MAG: MmgE/PrpD family protein [Devosia sp.]